MPTRYTTMPICEVPFPEGLGKLEYRGLESDMRHHLGFDFDKSAAHERAFWGDAYQAILAAHLSVVFDPAGDIIDIAREAIVLARGNEYFQVDLADESATRYARAFPPIARSLTRTEKEIFSWARYPPILFIAKDGSSLITDGRHRLSYLRARIQRADPEFPVLVQLSWE